MAGRWKSDLKWSDETPRADFLNRRALMAGGAALAGTGLMPAMGSEEELVPNTFDEITSYNYFYEFGWDKSDPKKHAGGLTTEPWAITVDGMVERPGTYDLADVLKDKAIEDRIYRFRCVEAWSMVIPWNGFELKDFLDQVGVQPSAKYVAFETLVRPSEMRGQRGAVNIPWPYVEGLRLDEAMNPLTLMATGIYGMPMPNQNGAPIRLVVPWKYGFKSIKSIVRMTLTEDEPLNTWQRLLPNEYGFYANVNPEVDHPRWSQATERKIGGGLFAKRVPWLMFTGTQDEVSTMFAGMDLRRYY